MERFFSELKHTADKVIKKSGELVELSKVKFNIANTKSEIGARFKELGELVYSAQKSDAQPDTSIINDTIEQIDALYEQLYTLMEENSSLKNEKLCPECEKSNPEKAQFCLACGYNFAAAEEDSSETNETV